MTNRFTSRRIWLLAGLFVFVTMWARVSAQGVTPNKQRAAAMRATLAAVDGELRAHGGSWEAWSRQLQPFRDDLTRIKGEKWPWPSKQGFVFQGKEVDMVMLDDTSAQPEGQRPLDAVVAFDRQLKARGIDLILVPIPDKLSVYPDYLSEKTPDDRMVFLAAKRLIKDLVERDVEVVDLYTVYRDFRRTDGDQHPLCYDKDSHWRNLGAQIAGEVIAARLKRYDFVQQALAAGNPYTTREGERTDGVKADKVLCIVNKTSGGQYRDTGKSPILLTGDSFSMYNMNTGGHITAQIARHIGMPLTLMCKEGLNSAMPVDLAEAAKRGYLDGRRVVIWTLGSRFLARCNWPIVPLPSTGGEAAAVQGVEATGTIAEASAPPAQDPPYPDYIMKFYVKDLRNANGQPVGEGDGVAHILAMKNRVVLPTADLQVGQQVKLKLTSWSLAEGTYGTIMNGTLPTVDLEIDKTHYWAELLP